MPRNPWLHNFDSLRKYPSTGPNAMKNREYLVCRTIPKNYFIYSNIIHCIFNLPNLSSILNVNNSTYQPVLDVPSNSRASINLPEYGDMSRFLLTFL